MHGDGRCFSDDHFASLFFLFFLKTTKTATSFLYQAAGALEPGEPGCPKVALPYLEGAGAGKDTPSREGGAV